MAIHPSALYHTRFLPISKMDKQKIINKMVSNARAIISNQIALPLGCLKMNRIIVWLNSSQ